MVGVLALFIGVLASFVAGVAVAMAFGYTDAVSLTTIGTGAVTYIVGPVTGAAIGASSEVMALSIAAGLVKAIVVMVATPFVAPYIGLNNPRSAVIFGGLIGTSSGVAGGGKTPIAVSDVCMQVWRANQVFPTAGTYSENPVWNND